MTNDALSPTDFLRTCLRGRFDPAALKAAGAMAARPELDWARVLAAAAEDPRPIFIVGGGQIYEQALAQGLVNAVHLTTIQTEVDGDIRFPDFPTQEFKLIRESHFESNIDYLYQYFEKTPSVAD